MYCIVLYCIVLFYIVLYVIILVIVYYIALSFSIIYILFRFIWFCPLIGWEDSAFGCPFCSRTPKWNAPGKLSRTIMIPRWLACSKLREL